MTDTISIAEKLAALLTREQRIVIEPVLPEREGRLATLNITTVGRDHGRIVGGGGHTIQALEEMIQSMDETVGAVRMTPSDDSTEKVEKRIEWDDVGVIGEFANASRLMVNPEVRQVQGGVEIITDEEVPQSLRFACETVFFNIGRSNKARCAITWRIA